ncbi:TonB-dependent receptor [Cytophagaceae bacterium DM2B3-1]|uniref:TonB-dependent receptor n=1 Tax=Xanthocytophaga flava TaxID=3048013 RepID=A0ABT7CKZ6_9BACT|nr:TonB-dependent receptor [Xanthocytophaga flavus]MDJ1469909.1 TonB-dependent receptor [Xanthocytophaga flavus]MDJ1494419.1 TonB-dependent receptor [Xanthocytophaga flavus]
MANYYHKGIPLFKKCMRISTLILGVSLLSSTFLMADPSSAQHVTMDIRASRVRMVFKAIEQQTGVTFAFDEKLVRNSPPITLYANRLPLADILQMIEKQTTLQFHREGNLIGVTEKLKEEQRLETDEPQPLQRVGWTVKGKVTDDKGEPLPSVSVRVKGTTQGTLTNSDGSYSIEVEGSETILIYSFIGFLAEEVMVGTRTTIDLQLQPDISTLTEVVVTGYGAQRKKDLIGAVSVVDVDQLKQSTDGQVTNQLQGRASGVTVVTSGQPGDAPQVRIRGLNTFGNNNPLYVVDGVPTTSIADLNTNDIASMQVLKDAGSASIYGSRAANGVVIITTKKGKDKVKIVYSAWFGIQTPPKGNIWNTLNPQEQAQLKFQVQKNSGLTVGDDQYGDGPSPVLPDYILPTGTKEGDPRTNPDLYYVNPNYTSPNDLNTFNQIVKANKSGTDWFHEIFKPAPSTSHNISLSGGSEQGNYLFSLNYFNQQGALTNTYLKRYTIRSNSQYNFGKHIRIGENLVYTITDNPKSSTSDAGSAIGFSFRMQPIVPVYDIMGNYAGSRATGMGDAFNPVAIRDRTRYDKGLDNRLFGNVFAEADVLKNFTLRTSFGGESYSGRWNSFAFPTYENKENTPTNTYSEGSYSGFNWTWTNLLTFHKLFGKHELTVVAGTEAYNSKSWEVGGSTQGYFSFDPNYVNLGNGSGTRSSYSSRSLDALYSLFSRVDYIYNDKYLLGAILRRDGSSKFINQRYGYFPAVSAGWRISKENFMASIAWVDELKLRANYGVMGNQINVKTGNAFTTYSPNLRSSYYDLAGTSGSGAYEGFEKNQIGNPNAIWEKDISTNIGIDASFFNGRLDIIADYYIKDIKDLLFNPPLIGTAGGGTVPFVNIGQMKNKGIDLQINSIFNIGQDLKLRTTLTFTSYNNKIIKVSNSANYFDVESRDFDGSFIVHNQVGNSIGQFYGYKVIGFWNSNEEITAANAEAAQKTGNPNAVYQEGTAPGRFKYADNNGDGQITAADRQMLGNPNPDFSYGLNLAFTYKQWDLSTFFYGVQGNQIWNQTLWWTDFNSSRPGAKSKTALYNSWTPENHNAKAPIQENASSFSTISVPNSYFVENGSYLRAKNIQLGYTLTPTLLTKLRIQQLRFYVQATNLFTLTKYSGLDPEVSRNTNGSPIVFGLDEGSYPSAKQYTVGLNLTF